jgi:hypothetical protein
MIAKVLTEKVMMDGNIRGRKIVKLENILTSSELPIKYLEGYPRFLLENTRGLVPGTGMTQVIVRANVHEMYVLILTNMIEEEKFQCAITWMKRAGARLTKIREKEKNEWGGEETIEI